MTDQDKHPQSDSLVSSEPNDNPITIPSGKRQFVEPEISQPVDVLEATTFFQAVDSGASG